METVVKVTDYEKHTIETVAKFDCPWTALAAINSNMSAINELGAGFRYQILVNHPECGFICVFSVHKFIPNTQWIFKSSSALN